MEPLPIESCGYVSRTAVKPDLTPVAIRKKVDFVPSRKEKQKNVPFRPKHGSQALPNELVS